MKFLEFVKFHSRILIRSVLAISIAFTCLWTFSEYRAGSSDTKSMNALNENLIELTTQISKVKSGKGFRNLVESNNYTVNSFIQNPNAAQHMSLLKTFSEPDLDRFQIDVTVLNRKLRAVSKYYEKVYSVLSERNYRQRHPVKDLYNSYNDNLPVTEATVDTIIASEIKAIEGYREYLLDSAVKTKTKAKADKYIGKALKRLRLVQGELQSSGETAINAYWAKNLARLKPQLLELSTKSYLKLAESQKNNFYMTTSLLTLLFITGIVSLLFIKNRKDYGLLKLKNKRIRELKTKLRFSGLKDDMLAILKDSDDLPIALLNRKDRIVWANKGFDSLLRTGLDKERNWENIRRRVIISTSTKTGVDNSIKIKGRGQEDYVIKSHPFVSDHRDFRVIKITEIGSNLLDSTVSTHSLYSKENAFNPFELVEDIVERLGTWSSVYEFKIAESKCLPSFYNMDPVLLKQEMGSLVASLMYFSKAHDYRPRFTFDIATSVDGFSFNMKMKDMHLKSEEIGTSIYLQDKRYVPLLDSFAKVEENLRSVDGKVVVKNYTTSTGVKTAEVQLIVKENYIEKVAHQVDYKDRGVTV